MTRSDCFSDDIDRSGALWRRENYAGHVLEIIQMKVLGGPHLGGSGSQDEVCGFKRNPGTKTWVFKNMLNVKVGKKGRMADDTKYMHTFLRQI